MIELRHLRAFIATARERNFTRAADMLAMTQPTLSGTIRDLEDRLGFVLFDRTTRSVELSAAGREFHGSIVRVIEDLDRVVTDMRDFAEVRRGRLTVAALPSIAAGRLPLLLAKFKRRFPEIDVTVIDAPAGALGELVRRGGADFGLGLAGAGPRDLRHEPLYDDELMLVCLEHDSLAGEGDLPWAALDGHAVAVMNTGTSVREMIDRAMGNADIHLRIEAEVEQMATAVGFVRAGLGVTILPSEALPAFSLEGLAIRRLTDPVMRRHLGVIGRLGRTFTPAAVEMIEMLRRDVTRR